MRPEPKGSHPRETRHRPATGQPAAPGLRNQSFPVINAFLLPVLSLLLSSLFGNSMQEQKRGYFFLLLGQHFSIFY